MEEQAGSTRTNAEASEDALMSWRVARACVLSVNDRKRLPSPAVKTQR